MINTIEELLEDVFYDWGFSPSPQIHENVTEGQRSFGINKTFIGPDKGKYCLSYKMDHVEIAEDVYKQFCNIADKVKENPGYEDLITEFHTMWMDKTLDENEAFKKFLKEIKS
jgi:hypothetical protein